RPSNCRKGRLGLELRARAFFWPADRRLTGWLVDTLSTLVRFAVERRARTPVAPLAAAELGGAFFQEVCHAFFEVLALEACHQLYNGKIEGLGQSLEHSRVHLALDYAQRARADAGCQLGGLIVNSSAEADAILGKNAVDQPQIQRFGGSDGAGGEEQVDGIGQTDNARQHPRDAVFRDESALREDCAEARILRRPAQIAVERNHEAEAHRRPVDGGDHRFRYPEKIRILPLEVRQLPFLRGVPGLNSLG